MKFCLKEGIIPPNIANLIYYSIPFSECQPKKHKIFSFFAVFSRCFSFCSEKVYKVFFKEGVLGDFCDFSFFILQKAKALPCRGAGRVLQGLSRGLPLKGKAKISPCRSRGRQKNLFSYEKFFYYFAFTTMLIRNGIGDTPQKEMTASTVTV